ncbi:proteoglycan-4 [Streptomyces sp. CB01580]|uniref:proteoglycan-4 n=1 Tax=Streptomyces sp. CB01580 TaxID=1703933 RepID=UPI00093B723C|nr:proteoglycan-4 [Streptomyces sp. CB01580]OKJ25182.1 proteoglycan-4 [Streptomyces sp. CB01580]
MIPRNRPVINEADIAARAGVPVAAWRRRDAPAFRQHVPNLLSGGRLVLYDLAQAEAYLAGKPVPALKTEPHPKDRLNATEAADILGIESSTVHAYAVQGYLSRGETVYGTRVWPRHEIEQRRDNPPSRGKDGGRPAGIPQGPRKAHPYENDPRLQTAAHALAAGGDTPVISRIAASLAQQHGGSARTWERLLTQARQTTTEP